MRIAIPVYNGRVSPVFDTAQHILIVDIEAGKETARAEHDVGGRSPCWRAKLLTKNDVSQLICGAISFPMKNLLELHGITVMANIAGGVGDVLEAFMTGTPLNPYFLMPECLGRGRRRLRHGRGGGRGGM